jgi:hypothetical protein
VIYFLDPHLSLTSTNLPHLEFTKYQQNVRIVNHYQASECLNYTSIKICKGCAVRFEFFFVKNTHVDVAKGGKAHFYQCKIDQIPTPLDSQMIFLFVGMLDVFYNCHSFGVTHQECSTPKAGCKKLRRKKSRHRKWILIDGKSSQCSKCFSQ